MSQIEIAFEALRRANSREIVGAGAASIIDALEDAERAIAEAKNALLPSGDDRPAPAATDTGLETVAWESMDNKLDPNDKLVYEVKFPRNGDKRLVYKSQAEELLAEKDIIIRSHLTTIASLEAKLAAANRELEPFARHAKERAVDAPEWRDADTVKIVVTISELRTVSALGE